MVAMWLALVLSVFQMTKDEADKLAMEALAHHLDVGVDRVQVRRATPVDWPDSSLGCPKDGESYAQVLTSGYLVTAQAEGQVYSVHVGDGRAVVCGTALRAVEGAVAKESFEPESPIELPEAQKLRELRDSGAERSRGEAFGLRGEHRAPRDRRSRLARREPRLPSSRESLSAGHERRVSHPTEAAKASLPLPRQSGRGALSLREPRSNPGLMRSRAYFAAVALALTGCRPESVVDPAPTEEKAPSSTARGRDRTRPSFPVSCASFSRTGRS